ncbi:hypothetical protein KP509_09G060800 [Ceratopteris richardii]|uniref:Pentatricopeptide repeat-containing protein n=1 Tax=Ceratopteris richardii TaxID=49495 RepID=A0A8T2U1R2_CERRI|nr:hypothetical protein KP509_09G060800 [Ceratopteris richardii]KAH7429667.1 hypothetical protein KP509_09G060800 [Ceratopteris richardii]
MLMFLRRPWSVSSSSLCAQLWCPSEECAANLFGRHVLFTFQRPKLTWLHLLRRSPVSSKARRFYIYFSSFSSASRYCCTSSLASTLQSSAHGKNIQEGHRVHNQIVMLGLDDTDNLVNLLLHMYGCCGCLEDSGFLFSRSSKRDPFSFNIMISAYARSGRFTNVLQLFSDMFSNGIKLDKYIFASILSACADNAEIQLGMHLHFFITCEGFKLDVTLQNAILNLYVKYGSLYDARAAFHDLDNRNEASYNLIISGYTTSKQNDNAIATFMEMMMQGVMPGKVTFIAAISACTDGRHRECKYMHIRFTASEYKSNIVPANSLISTYGKYGDLDSAVSVFDWLLHRSIVSWNALIMSHAQCGFGRKAYVLFQRLHQEGELPNSLTFFSLSPGFDSLTLRECRELHIRVCHNGFDANDDAKCSLINMYSKCSGSIDALELFDSIHKRDLRAWNALGVGIFGQNSGKSALWQFYQMLQEGILPDKVTFLNIISGCASEIVVSEGIRIHSLLASTRIQIDVVLGSALLNMYGKCGSLENALNLFWTMPERNEYSWASMITAYAVHGELWNCLLMFEQMQWEGIKRDKVSVLCLLCACANKVAFNVCKYVHVFVLETGLHLDIAVQNSLLTVYSKCGSIPHANILFDKMPRKNLVSWTAAIAAFAQHGQGKEAFSCYEQMQVGGTHPDNVTFIEILSACSRAGLIDEAYYTLASMIQKYGMEPNVDHFNCIIDLLGRVGKLDMAEQLIFSMPARPTVVSWLTLLGACRSRLDLERGEYAAKWVCNLSFCDASPYVTLSNLYAVSGRFDDAAYAMHELWLWAPKDYSDYPLHASMQ